MSKHRSLYDYAAVLAGDEQGFNLGLDGSIFVKRETTARTFNPPVIGTQGKSTSGAAPSTDISGGTDKNFKVSVDGGAIVDIDMAPLAGLNTGAAIAAALESEINAALIAAGQDGRVWCEFAGGLYVIWSQKTGTTSSVVITDGTTLNVADDLKLGTANTGVEVVGVNDQDALLYTTGGPMHSQPVESNNHRSGRFHRGIVRKKIVAEFDIDMMINMKATAGDSLDKAVRLLWEHVHGKETVVASTSINYEQGLPNFTFSLVRVSTIFGEYYTGAYCNDQSVAFPGAGPATVKFTGKAQKASIAGIAQVNGAVVASATVVLDAGQAKRFYNQGDNKARVMVVDPDGRTILHGADGSLYVNTIVVGTHTLTLSAAVSVGDNGFIVPWHPGAVQETTTDNIYTDLQGSFKVNASGSAICVSNIDINHVNDHVHRDECFGKDANFGFIAGNRMTSTLAVTFDLSNDNFQDVVQARDFAGFQPVVILGDPTSGRYLEFTAQKWIPEVPALELPENGTTPTTLTGICYESAPGRRDPYKYRFL